MTHNMAFEKPKSTDDDWDFFQGNETWETRQVMLSLHKRIKVLEDIVQFEQKNIKILAGSLDELSKKYNDLR